MKFDGNIVILDFLETYHELGEFTFKIVLNPDMFKNSQDSTVSITDPAGNEIPIDIRKWGRKLNCTFSINENMENGVYVISINLVRDDGDILSETLRFWIIK